MVFANGMRSVCSKGTRRKVQGLAARTLVLWACLAALAITIAGCSKPTNSSPQSAADQGASGDVAASQGQKQAGPAAAAYEFLEALRSGNDEKATAMLSTKAREKTASLNRSVTPPASDTARFTVGQVDYVNDDGARVSCTWTDYDEEGQPKSDNAIWVLRREDDGWRIVGVAAQVFPGEKPLLLNFEDPEDMFRKQKWVREEIRRRMEANDLQAQKDEKTQESTRR